jgi:predicted  nucleic acid-binding Zn-ribbon protein
MSRAAALRRLQDADARLARLRAELAGVEAALRGDSELDRRRDAAGAAQRAHSSAEDAATVAEAEIAALQKRVRDLDRRLYGGSVHNPNELLEMQHELETLRARKDEAEERALALMESAEAASTEEHSAARALATREAERSDELVPLQHRRESLTSELAEATANRAAVADEVPRADLALYDRVSARRHPAVVPLIGDSCGGCHLPVSIEERRAVRTGDGIVQCSNCDRILVT